MSVYVVHGVCSGAALLRKCVLNLPSPPTEVLSVGFILLTSTNKLCYTKHNLQCVTIWGCTYELDLVK